MKLDESFWGDTRQSAGSDAGNIHLATTASSNPDQEAEMMALGKRFGVPTDLVRADYAGFRERAAVIDRRESADAPGVQSWVAKSPDNAALAADKDLRVMGRIERSIRSLGEGFGGQFVGSGLTGVGHSLDAIQRRIMGAAANLVLPEPMAGGKDQISEDSIAGQPIGEGFKALGEPAKQYWREQGVPLYQQDFGDQVAAGIGQVIGQLPLSMSPAGWAMMFGQGADQLADKVAKDDAPQWKKDLSILGGGTVTAVTEKFALDRWAKLGPLASLKNPLASRAAGVGIASAAEGAQEFSENVLQDTLRQQLTNKNADINIGDAAGAGGVGATVGGIVRTVIESALHIKGRHQQQAVQQIVEAAKEADIGKRSPEKMAEFANQVAEGTGAENVFIPADQFTRYFQEIGANPEEAAALLEATNYAEAVAAGTDVVIPMGAFVAKLAPSEHMPGLMADVRLNQGDLTARELELMKANEAEREQYLADQYAQLVADGEKATGINTAIDRVVSDVEGQLLAAGVEPSTAKTQAQVMRGVSVLAQRAYPDMDPVAASERLWGQYGLTVQRDLPPILVNLKNADVQIDPLLERLRAGAIPSEQDAFGQPLHEFIRAMGGVVDQGGELSAQDVDTDNAPFVRNLIQSMGMDFDAAREMAAQQGFAVGETEAEFIDALLGSIKGSPVYSAMQENTEALDQMQTLEALDRALKDAGVDLNAVDNATARKMLEQAGEVSGARYDQSVDAYQGDTIEVDGKTRPTTNSNGKPIAQTEEGLRNFWRWFGGSLVTERPVSSKQKINELRPMVVYHGTRGDFDAFAEVRQGNVTDMFGDEDTVTRRGIFFAENADFATTFANQRGEGAANVMPVYLDIKNALYLDEGFTDEYIEQLEAAGFPDAKRLRHRKATMVWAEFDDEAGEQFISAAKRAGYDGVYMEEEGVGLGDDADTQVVWVAFNPTQIKSATGNRGTFDPASPNILYQSGNIPAMADKDTVAGTQAPTSAGDGSKAGADVVAEQTTDWAKVGKVFVGDGGRVTVYFMKGFQPGKNEKRSVENSVMEAFRPILPDGQYWRFTNNKNELNHIKSGELLRSKNHADNSDEIGLSVAEGAHYGIQGYKFGYIVSGDVIGRGSDGEPLLDVGKLRPVTKLMPVDEIVSKDRAERAALMKARGWTHEQIADIANGTFKIVTKPNEPSASAGSDVLYQFAGPAANTADQRSLDTAQQRLAAGEDAETVRKETGWFKGVDGKWRFEIDDSGAKLKKPYPTKGQRWGDVWLSQLPEGSTLSKMIDHPALFAAYPSLADIPVSTKKGAGASYSVQSRQIDIGEDVPMYDVVSMLLHEIQHGIQTIEGFASGGNASVMQAELPVDLGFIDRINDWNDTLREYGYPESKLIDTTPSVIRMNDDVSETLQAQAGWLQRAFENNGDQYLADTLDDFTDNVLGKDWHLRGVTADPYMAYRRLAGEVEARNTQERQNLTAEQRREQSPESTQDVPSSDVIVVFNGKEMASAPTPANAEPSDKKRGFLEIGANRQMRIGLTENANLSTFLHESGHFYLEMMGDLAADANASQQVKDDYAAILKWFGVESRDQIKVEQHEQFARANEAYLMEGNAPAPELRGAFQRFKAWLTSIYRSLTALDVKLSDEVRGVFDRIYATDQEIEAAKDMVDVSPLFMDAATMGLTDAEFAAYRDHVSKVSATAQDKLQAKLMREYQRGLKDWYKEQREAVRGEVMAEVDAQPVYRAFDALVKGSMDGEPFKLSKVDLVRRYGETYLKNLPRGFQRVYAAEGGIDLDTAAEMAGFHTGDDLVKALVEMRNRKELIEAETDKRMAERYGDMMLDGTMADAAKEALHNEHRESILAIELRALKRKANEVAPFVKVERDKAKAQQAERVAATQVPPASMFRRAAAGIIDQMQVKDIQPNAYLIAGRKAAREAFAALARNDNQTAATAKQRELLNHYLYLEATKAKQEADAFQKYAKSFESGKKRERIGKAGSDYLGQIDALLARYELAKVTLNALSRRERLREFIAAREAEGDIVVIPEELQDESRQINWKQAQMSEIRALSDALKNIEHLANFKNKLLRKRAAIDFAVVKAQLLDALENNIEGSTGEIGKLNDVSDTIKDKIVANLRKFDAGLIKVEQLIEWLDGGKINGPWARYLFDLADDAQVREYDLHAQVTKRLQDLHESMPKDWGHALYDKTDVRLPGVDHALTRYDLISIAMNTGNQSNYDKLLKGRGWSDGQVQAALSRLTDQDWAYVQGVWDTLESLWPEIADLQKRLAGVEPDKVAPKKIITASGKEFAGGYFPLVYDPALSKAGEKQDDASESVQDFMARGYGRANTDKGHTKGRLEDFAAPIRLDFEQVLTSHLSKVIKDISHREAILAMNKILNDGQIKAALIDKLGMDKYQLLNTWEQALISDRADTLHRPLQWYNAIFRGLRTNTAIVTMGWKLSTALSQVAGFAASMDTVNPVYLGVALRDFVRSPLQMVELTMEKSGEMRHRAGTIERDVKDQLLKTRGKHGMVVAVQRSAFYLTAMMDRTVSVPTWVGGYRQALDAGLSEEDAVRAGDRAVRLSQGAGGAKDLAGVQRNSELMKMLTMYYTPFSVLYARLRDMGHKYKEPKDLPLLVARSIALVILPAVLGDLLAGRPPDDDEDKTLWAIRKSIMYPFASVPVIRDLASWQIEPKLAEMSGGEMRYQPGYKMTPIIGAVEKIAGIPGKAMDGWTGDRPWDDVAWDTFEASGYVFGLPTAQPRITGEYLYDLFTGQAAPDDAAEAMHDVLFRRPIERR